MNKQKSYKKHLSCVVTMLRSRKISICVIIVLLKSLASNAYKIEWEKYTI